MKTIIKLLILDIRKILSSKLTIAYLFLTPLIILLINVFLVSVLNGGGWTFFLATSIPSLFIILNVKSEFRECTLYKNYLLSKSKGYIFYIEGFVFYVLLFTFMVAIYNIAFLIYGNWLHILLGGYWFSPIGVDYFNTFLNVPLKKWFYFITAYSILNYSIFLFIYSFFNEKKSRMMMIISFVILSIPFGGGFGYIFYVAPVHDVNGTNTWFLLDEPYYISNYLITNVGYRESYRLFDVEEHGLNLRTTISIFEIFLCPWSGLNQLFTSNIINTKMIVISDLTEWTNLSYGIKIYSDNLLIGRFTDAMWHDGEVWIGEIEIIILIIQSWIFTMLFLLASLINRKLSPRSKNKI